MTWDIEGDLRWYFRPFLRTSSTNFRDFSFIVRLVPSSSLEFPGDLIVTQTLSKRELTGVGLEFTPTFVLYSLRGLREPEFLVLFFVHESLYYLLGVKEEKREYVVLSRYPLGYRCTPPLLPLHALGF